VREIDALPRAGLGARFPALLRRLDAALGRTPEAGQARRAAPRFRTRVNFAEPIATAKRSKRRSTGCSKPCPCSSNAKCAARGGSTSPGSARWQHAADAHRYVGTDAQRAAFETSVS